LNTQGELGAQVAQWVRSLDLTTHTNHQYGVGSRLAL